MGADLHSKNTSWVRQPIFVDVARKIIIVINNNKPVSKHMQKMKKTAAENV
jgi:hypothetical protein